MSSINYLLCIIIFKIAIIVLSHYPRLITDHGAISLSEIDNRLSCYVPLSKIDDYGFKVKYLS